ncbi:DUF6944 family repetitive protein [Bacillus massiliigorillae]|uniref:DUF6944 family repetitive protein n=1 Tax=Bacillus massiliigorillae TaxID=1243664 RepID=UPI00039BC793|nr:hypothetical protein [Bacillus massiliigorillae]
MNDAAVKYVVMEAVNTNEDEKHQEHMKELEEKFKEEREKEQEAWDRIYKENGENLELSGGWFVLAGTIITALGETKDFVQETEEGKPAVVTGSAVEAFGNSLQAIGLAKVYEVERLPPYLTGSVGCWLQAVGNTTNAVATQIEIQGEEEEGESLNALGSGVQAYGAYLEAVGNSGLPPFIMQETLITGNSLIAIGSTLDAIGQIYLLQDKEEAGEILIVAGAWIQVVGAALEVYAISIRNSYSAFEERSKEETERYSYAMYRGGR